MKTKEKDKNNAIKILKNLLTQSNRIGGFEICLINHAINLLTIKHK